MKDLYGDIANAMRPKFNIEYEWVAEFDITISPAEHQRMREGETLIYPLKFKRSNESHGA